MNYICQAAHNNWIALNNPEERKRSRNKAFLRERNKTTDAERVREISAASVEIQLANSSQSVDHKIAGGKNRGESMSWTNLTFIHNQHRQSLVQIL